MKDKLIFETLRRYKGEIESHGHTVYAIMLKGSQNYNLDDEESDIDANAILIPKLHEIGKQISPKYTFETGEVTCHDIYSFAEIVSKGNPQWIEVCHTKYKLGGDLSLFDKFEVNPSALKGMAYEKVKAFDKLYPSRTHMIDKFGYDPKQLHHIIRLYDLLKADVKNYVYSDPYEREQMIDIKRGGRGKVEANIMKNAYMELIVDLCEERKLTYTKQEIDYYAIDKIVWSYLLHEKRGKEASIMIRTFGGDIPKFIKQCLTNEELEQYRGKDVGIYCKVEIDEY